MKLLIGVIFWSHADRQGDQDNFVPPEKRFDFNRMERQVKEDPNDPGMGILNYKLQTIEDSKEQDKLEREKMQFATPEEIAKIHEQHLLDFDMGQDLNLLENSQDLQNLNVVLKSHRCDACRIVAMFLSKEFWDLEERFSRKTRMLTEEIVYDSLEAFCHADRWENVGLTQTVKINETDGKHYKDLWRLTGPGFETWELRGEVTATSQLWPSRFSKVCHELIEDHDEWELYEHWKSLTKDSVNPIVSHIDDLLCFSEKKSDCNKFRNPSSVKKEPVTQEILYAYEKFKDEINEKRAKDRKSDRKKLLKEQKRIMDQAIQRQKEKEEKENAEKGTEEEANVKSEL